MIAEHANSLAVLIAVCLIGYVMVLWRWHAIWLPVLLATLPVLDLAPWTGQFFFDEYDCLFLLTAIIVFMRQNNSYLTSVVSGWSVTSMTLFVGVGLSALGAIYIGSSPFPAIDLNALNNYLSPYNALRTGKGMIWAGLMLLMMSGDILRNPDMALRHLTLGFCLGALGASLAVIWERLSFTGLLNFESGYRVVGLFSGMHTGGAYVEAYLVTALPFVLWAGIKGPQRWLRIGAWFIFLLGCYALLVTYARGGYIAFILSCLILFSGLLWRNVHRFKRRYTVVALLVLLLTSSGLLFSYADTPMHKRFSHMHQDSLLRYTHWRQILDLMDDSWRVQLFGEGQGTLTRLYQQRYGRDALSEFRFVHDADRNYLQLSGGDPLYYEQIVDVDRNEKYDLNVVARNTINDSEIYFTLCRKWMLYEDQCQWFRVTLPVSAEWQAFHFAINPLQGMPLHWYAFPTTKLSVANYQEGSVVDIASVSLRSASGKELISNGDFALGSRYWFFTTDNHLPWHYKNLFLQIYFEQGWVGLLLILSLLLYSAWLLVLRRFESAYPAPMLAAAMTGFLTVGLIDSLFDFPRMGMLFYFLIGLIHFRKYTKKATDR